MNATRPEAVRWSPRRWTFTIVAALAVHVAGVFLLGDRPREAPAPPRFRATIYPATDPWSAQQLDRLPTLADPTLFALPHPHGFSSVAWLTFVPIEHRLTDWTEPPRWLDLAADRLGETYALLARTNVTRPLLVADKPLPRLTGLDTPVPSDPVPAASRLRLEGPLSQRPLLTPLALRSWSHSEIVSNTLVEVSVNADGHVAVTALIAESGLPEADQTALRLAASARFAPLPPAGPVLAPDPRLTWGRLIFQWHTAPPPATNGAAAASPP
jgi:hypothetical protein